MLIMPNFSTDFIYDGLTWYFPELLGSINPLLGAVPYIAKGFLAGINDIPADPFSNPGPDPYWPITLLFISFLDFPSCLAWFIPGFLIGYNRNKQCYNVEN